MSEKRPLIAYLRTSTKDKGQDPERQLEKILDWAAREGFEVIGKFIDKGTSASRTNPYERPIFLEACEAARAASAAGIVVETADRFTRQGTYEFGWANVELGRRYGLELYQADIVSAVRSTIAGEIVPAVQAAASHQWVKDQSEKVRAGMARARNRKVRLGRPAKPLSPHELEQVHTWRTNGGLGRRRLGWEKIAHELSKHRDAFSMSDAKAQRRRRIGKTTVRLAYLDYLTHNGLKQP